MGSSRVYGACSGVKLGIGGVQWGQVGYRGRTLGSRCASG